MKARLKYLGLFFIIILTTFLMMKVVFMLYNAKGNDFGVTDIFAVLWHGLPLDLSTTSYLTSVPLLVCILSLWLSGKWPRLTTKIYSCIIAPLLSLILVADTVLYRFWQFKLDATIFNYIDSPKEAVASVSVWFVLIAILCIATLTIMLLIALKRVWRTAEALGRRDAESTTRTVYSKISKGGPSHKVLSFLVLLFTGGVLFLLIRGGIGRSTMNVGYVYYSQNQFLNHSAVNPTFSLLSSSLKVQKFDKLYRFYDPAACDSLFAQLQYSTESLNSDTLLTTRRPDIMLIIMEGCGSVFLDKNFTPNLNHLAEEGIFFSRCYANSFRTDRGLVCTLSGYPSFPDISVMKLPEKSRTLPSIARSLVANGYSTHFLYGGDINFTNTKSYLLSTGFQQARGYETFPLSVRHTHSWGVQDHITLDTLYNIIKPHPNPPLKGGNPGARVLPPEGKREGAHSFTACLTLSSHEDWQVPYNRIKNDHIANAMAYLDDCIGKLVARLKASPAWNDLLLIILPDHSIGYPAGITEANPERNRIPIIWTGGAVRKPRRIEVICNQTDLAATLLGQLGIPHSDFSFSRDVLSSSYTYPCAVHTFSGGISFIDSTGYIVEDLNAKKIIKSERTVKGKNKEDFLSLPHAYLQHTITDFAER